MTRFWDGRTDSQTDGRSDCTPRPAFAFGDAGKNSILLIQFSSATALKQLKRISCNVVIKYDKLCTCTCSQEILISFCYGS